MAAKKEQQTRNLNEQLRIAVELDKQMQPGKRKKQRRIAIKQELQIRKNNMSD
jgi:hypothetical protein